MFLKNMRARIISRIHKTNPKYRQCHRLIGVGYILGHGVFFGKNFFGFIEKTLPDTITTDFEFVHPPEIHELMTRTIDVLSRQKFDLKLDPKNDNSIIVSYARLGSRCVVRVRLIKLSDKLSCGQYRLISTWVQETLLW
jgi:hypothetical protein